MWGWVGGTQRWKHWMRPGSGPVGVRSWLSATGHRVTRIREGLQCVGTPRGREGRFGYRSPRAASTARISRFGGSTAPINLTGPRAPASGGAWGRRPLHAADHGSRRTLAVRRPRVRTIRVVVALSDRAEGAHFGITCPWTTNSCLIRGRLTRSPGRVPSRARQRRQPRRRAFRAAVSGGRIVLRGIDGGSCALRPRRSPSPVAKIGTGQSTARAVRPGT